MNWSCDFVSLKATIVRFVLLLTIISLVVSPVILLRDFAIGWMLLDWDHQHNMAVTLISKPIYFSVIIGLLIWRKITSFAHWLIIMGVLCTVLFPLAVIGLEVTDTKVGVLIMAPEPATRFTLYGVLFLFELLLTFLIAGVMHRILVGKDQS